MDAKRTFFNGKELIVRKENPEFEYPIVEEGLLITSKVLDISTHPLQGYKKEWKEVIYKTYENAVRFCYARTLTSIETGEDTTFTYTCKDSLNFDTLYGTFEGHGIKVNSYTDKHGRQCFGIIDNNGCGDMYTKEEFLNIFGKKD